MKRDYELIKRILLKMEADPDPGEYSKEYGEFGMDDVPMEYFYAQIRIMTREGLIESEEERNIAEDFIKYNPTVITTEGYKFLEMAKNDTIWKKVLEYVKETGKDIATVFLIEKFKSGF